MKRKAIVIATQKQIEVYKLNRGTWCDCEDCTTEYDEKELRFI